MNDQLGEFRLIVFVELGVLSHKGHLNTYNHYIVYDYHPDGREGPWNSSLTSALFVNTTDTILLERERVFRDYRARFLLARL